MLAEPPGKHLGSRVKPDGYGILYEQGTCHKYKDYDFNVLLIIQQDVNLKRPLFGHFSWETVTGIWTLEHFR